MAHNNSTPESVLNAPQLEPVLVHATAGPNRQERRFTKVKVKESHRNEPARRLLSKKDKLAVSRRERKLRKAVLNGTFDRDELLKEVVGNG